MKLTDYTNATYGSYTMTKLPVEQLLEIDNSVSIHNRDIQTLDIPMMKVTNEWAVT